ncbi:hypothetical protein MASR1M107_00260 [Ignavibacteriales bacterium]
MIERFIQFINMLGRVNISRADSPATRKIAAIIKKTRIATVTEPKNTLGASALGSSSAQL